MRWIFILIMMMPVSSLIFGQNFDFKKQKSGSSVKLGADDIHLSVNSSLGTAANHAFFLQNSFTPSINFDVTKRFSTQFGVGTCFSTYTNYPVLTTDMQVENQNFNLTTVYAYVAGNYKLKPKMNLYTMVLVEDATLNYKSNIAAIRKQYKDVTVGLNYKISSKVTINAEFNISDHPYNGFTSYSYQPFGLGSSMFHPSSW